MQINYETNRPADVQLFGEWLVNKGELSHENLCEALVDQRKRGGRLGQVLLRLKMINDDELTQSLADYLKLGYFRFDGTTKIDMDVARQIPERIANRFSLLAVGQNDEEVIVVMTDPLNVIAIDTVERRLQRPVKILVASSEDIEKGVQMVYHGSYIDEQRLRDLLELEVTTEDESYYKDQLMEADISNEEEASKAPVIRLVDLLLSQAVKRKASDVHIEPQEKKTVVRMRIDGVLRETVPPPRSMQAAVITRIKILSNMDIAERRLPQDGRFKIRAPDRDIDVRVSSLPTIYGEKIAMRILDKKAVNHNLDVLGFEPDFLTRFKNVLKQPHGIAIVTGPTGCGKTTTMYSALNYLKDPKKNITTVENPVEYRLVGINQVQVRPEIDLGFASCLRTILRQDPDIILIGEIRDKETVEIAIQAAMTGHLVLSTFHTNDAPSGITRLMYMRVEPYLLASSLNLVVAQRLVRRICQDCKEPFEPDPKLIEQLNITQERAQEITFYRGRGCNNCDQTGYLGRVPIFESLVMDAVMKEAVMARATEAEIRSLAREAGGGSLLESGIRRIAQGITSTEEVLEATFAENTFI